MSSIISGPVGTINICGGQFVAITEADIQRLMLENIAARASHDANNTGYELPKCYPGTREAIQRDLTKWVENMERRYSIYWLYAPAGSGKTAIAKTLADSSSHPPKQHLLASFFFRKASPHQNTEERFIATIAYQIKTNLPQTSRFITNAIKADTAIFLKELRVQMDKLILEPLDNAWEAANPTERRTWPRLLVIDGLDECSGQGVQRKILDVVSHLVHRMSFPLAVFLSSRPEVHIRAAFQGDHLSNVSLKICLSNTYSSWDDLRKFFVGRFQEVVKAHSHILDFPNGWPGEAVIDQLIKNSSGHFIHASTVMKYIDAPDDDPMKRLDIVRGLTSIPDEENPFAELDALYRHILSSVKPKHLPTVIRVLQVTLSRSHGQVRGDSEWTFRNDLASFLNLKPGELEYSLRTLEGVLVGTEESAYMPSVKFYHASFGDFLLDESRSGPYFIDSSLANTQFVVCLLRYILHVNDDSIGSASTSALDERTLKLTRAFRSVLNRLPSISPTEELHRNLHFVTQSTTAQKVIRICTRPFTTNFPPLLEWGTDLFSWQLMDKFATALGKLSLNCAMILERNLRDEVKKYVSQELPKYAEAPLCHLIPLLTSDSAESSLSTASIYRFIWSRFLLNDHILQTDRTSLNLVHAIWSGFSNIRPQRRFLRQLIREIGYKIQPDAYSATCLCVLKCIVDLSPHTAQRLAHFVSLEASSNLLALWDFFCGFGEPLLGRAGPSTELQKCLKENMRIIYFFSRMDTVDPRRQEMWQSMKEAIDGYLLRNQLPSSAPVNPLEEPTGSLFPLFPSKPSMHNYPVAMMMDPVEHKNGLREPPPISSVSQLIQIGGSTEAVANPSHLLSLSSQFKLQYHGKGKRREREVFGGGTKEDADTGTKSQKRLKSN